MTDQPLSPAAQAVLDAFLSEWNVYAISEARWATAAALRAAANDWRVDTEFIAGVEYIRTSTLERIAGELEGSN